MDRSAGAHGRSSEDEGGTLSIDQQALVLRHLPKLRSLVFGLAAQLPPHVDREELVQAGALGLIDAARRFDPSRGCSFSGYARIRIRGAVIDGLRALDWVSGRVRLHVRRMEGAAHDLEQRKAGRAELEELADTLGLTLERFEALRRKLDEAPLRRSPDSAGEEVDGALAGPLHASAANPHGALALQRVRDRVEDALASLPQRERTIVLLHYWDELALSDVGKTLGLDESRIRALLARALLRLQRSLRGALE